MLLAANGLCHNPFKDYKTLRQAISIIASQWQDGPLSVIAVGGTAPSESIRNVHIQYVPYQKEPRQLATYYQAADLFLHAAHLDNFPTTILEALACGTPVVATDVGGIPEQITTGETGYLTRAGDADALANATLTLLKRPDIWRFCAEHAATHAAEYFSLQRMTEEYLRWGAELLSHFTASTPGKGEDSL